MSIWNKMRDVYATDKYQYEVEESLEVVKAKIEI